MNENIGLLEIYNIYKKYMKYILSVTFSVIFISIIYSIFATPLYKSYISIYPASYDSKTTLSSFENIASRVGFNLPGAESSTFNIPDIINKLSESNIQITKLNISPANLDDVFLKITGNKIKLEETSDE